MKKFLAILMSLVVMVSSSIVVFADPPELETPVTEEEPEGMWASGTYTVPANSSKTVVSFNIPDRYFAFEATATLSGGGTSSSNYRVQLRRGTGVKSSTINSIDGVMHKVDWIDISTTGTYNFYVTNYANSAISVTLTYYSWV